MENSNKSDLSITDFDCSDSDKDQNEQLSIERLQELNDDLTKENAELRSQFEEAVSISSKMQELHAKNSTLSIQLRDALSEKDDLSHRLEIAIQTNKELTSHLSQEKNKASSQYANDQTLLNSEIERIQKTSNAQIEKILQELNEVKAAYDQSKVDMRMVVSRVDRLLLSAERRFGQSFSNFDDFISFIEKPAQLDEPAPKIISKVQSAPSSPISQENLSNIEKRFKSMKNKVKAANNARYLAEEEIANLSQQIEKLQISSKKEIALLESKLAQANETAISYRTDAERTISSLNSKIDNLKSELHLLNHLRLQIIFPLFLKVVQKRKKINFSKRKRTLACD